MIGNLPFGYLLNNLVDSSQFCKSLLCRRADVHVQPLIGLFNYNKEQKFSTIFKSGLLTENTFLKIQCRPTMGQILRRS
jgi:hypothetical protein